MISEWMQILLGDDYVVRGIDYFSKNRNFYIRQNKDLKMRRVESLSANEFINEVKGSIRFNLYKKYLSEIKQQHIYDSDCHGLNHNERVSLFAFYLANSLGLTDREMKLALYSAFYHDIGRVNDLTDDAHGKRSADLIGQVVFDVNDDELNILKTILTCHSIDDKNFVKVLNKNKVENVELCEKLFQILKDSDALDRVRLDNPLVVPSMLRLDDSRELILASYQLYDNYEKIKENITEKDL